METINQEREELLVIDSSYKKLMDTVKYYTEVIESDNASLMNQLDCINFTALS